MSATEGRRTMGPGGQLLIILAVALVIVGGFAVWQIGSDFLRTLALILVAAIALALVIAATSLPIRAWKRKDNIGETHYVDGTKTIVKEVRVLDGRAPAQADVKILQAPAQPGSFYPDLLRAAWQTGRLDARSAMPGQNGGNHAAYTEADLPELDLGDDGWNGDITQ